MQNKSLLFVIMGKWHLYHKVAENMRSRGWNVICITYGSQLRQHCVSLDLYSEVVDLSTEVESKEVSLSHYAHFFTGGLSINEIIKTDRYFSSNPSLRNITTQSFFAQVTVALDKRINLNNVEGIFYEPSSAIPLIAGEICRFYGKSALYPQWGRTSLGMSVSHGYDGPYSEVTHSFYKITHADLSVDELNRAKWFIGEVKNGNLAPKNKSNLIHKTIWLRLKDKILNVLSFFGDVFTTKYQIKNQRKLAFGFLFRLVKKYRQVANKRFFTDSFEMSKIVFFPLHYDPDLASLLYARNNSNQIEVIRKLSLNIPDGFTLVVKEHPAMKLGRKKSFYRQLSSHNVVLVDKSFSSRDLINIADCVITLSGTVGFESVFFGKRPIVLGDDYFEIPELFDRVFDTNNLKGIIASNLKCNTVNHLDVEKFALANLMCITEIEQYSGTAHYENVSVDFVDPIVDAVEQRINAIKSI